jgi:hypothetical protein
MERETVIFEGWMCMLQKGWELLHPFNPKGAGAIEAARNKELTISLYPSEEAALLTRISLEDLSDEEALIIVRRRGFVAKRVKVEVI